MLLIECTLVLEQVELPLWLLPYHTTHNVVSLLHRLFPAYMNGCRCIIGAFVVDRKARMIETLQELSEATRTVTQKAISVVQTASLAIRSAEGFGAVGGADAAAEHTAASTMSDYLKIHRTAQTEATVKMVKEKAALISDARALRRKDKQSASDYTWIRNLAIYLAARFVVKMPAAKP
jgi:hypothetical protein